MIIIIGMDNTGKTTLAQSMAEKLKVKIVKSDGPDSQEKQQSKILHAIVSKRIRGVRIYERFPLFEEMVYGPILRSKSNFKVGDYYYEALKKSKPTIVYCRPDIDSVLNFGQRSQMSGVRIHGDALLREYDELYFRINRDFLVIPFNYKLDEVDTIVSICKARSHINQITGGIL